VYLPAPQAGDPSDEAVDRMVALRRRCDALTRRCEPLDWDAGHDVCGEPDSALLHDTMRRHDLPGLMARDG
jgi:hypothetical protein